MTISPEMLAAYADGELGPEETAKVEAALASDPDLAREVDAHRALRSTLSAHFAPILDMPVPERLKAPLQQADETAGDDNVVSLAEARQAKARRETARPAVPRWAMGGALAASLAIGLVVGGQISGGGMIASDNGRLVASGPLDTALSSQLASAQQQDMPVRILLSFKSGDGRYCRGFETESTAGIACRADGKWDLVRTQAGERNAPAQYRQAGSAQAAILAAAQDMAADGALDADAERKALDSGWQN